MNYSHSTVSNFTHAVDHSRVILKDADQNVIGSDYINANFVGVSSPPNSVFNIPSQVYTCICTSQNTVSLCLANCFKCTDFYPRQLSNGRFVSTAGCPCTCHCHFIKDVYM